ITHVGSSSEADATVASIVDGGGVASAVLADAREPLDGAAAVAATVERHGGLDIVVNNAGVMLPRMLGDTDDDAYATTFEINVRGALQLVRAAEPHLREGGRVIVVSATIANDFFSPGLALYGASKAAINAFVQGWSRDLGPRGITVNAVVPGPIDTAMNPADSALADQLRARTAVGRYGEVDEVAALVAFLAGPEAGFITGTRMVIDGGLTA
ncbi:MAG: SDR family oxidoreductase, partial [Actinomycetota bacterium]